VTGLGRGGGELETPTPSDRGKGGEGEIDFALRQLKPPRQIRERRCVLKKKDKPTAPRRGRGVLRGGGGAAPPDLRFGWKL